MQYLNEKDIFRVATSIEDEELRSAFLDSACERDSALRDRVKLLLDAHSEGDFLARAPIEDLNGKEFGDLVQPGSTIGRYKLLEQIGEGGFGVVYMADQIEPIQRRVAVKIIKAGMDTKSVVARFEAERQALGLMDHFNIAKVFDAGATESGRPFFVMELVRGVPITEYCDAHDLSIEQRLRLFVAVCSAVQHAHQKGIIHRDIKPNNILVSTDGDQPFPKVIDFGIAKATQGRLTDKTLFTQFRQFIGTPVYMSPEQAQMSPGDVDTRTDVYSLGVLLYELLTGNTPLDDDDLRRGSPDCIGRRIREEEPATPSTRVSTMSRDRRATIAKNRRIDSDRLGRLIRGELDWIVMRAIEKERVRRYETASALAADVERHLDNEPVEAGPPTLVYRLQKVVSKNRMVVITTAVLLLALIIGTVASSLGLVQAQRANRSLEDAHKKLESQLALIDAARQRAAVNLYVAEINRAAMAYDSGHLSLAISLLDRHRASYGERFEWRLVNQMCQHGDAIHTFHEHSDRVTSVAVSKIGTIASGSADRTVRLFDIERKREIAARTMSSPVTRVRFSPDGNVIAVAEADRDITLLDADSLELKSRLPRQQTRASDIEFLPDHGMLAVASGKAPLQLWDFRSPTESPITIEKGNGQHIGVSPTGHRLSLAFPNLDLWQRVEGGGYRKSAHVPLPHEWSTRQLAFSNPTGEHIATTDGRAQIRIWEAAALEKAEIAKTPKSPQAIFRTSALSLAYSPSGRHIASGNRRGSLDIWRGRPPWKLDGQPIATMRGHTDAIESIAYSHDGRLIVTGGADHKVKMWPGSQKAVEHNRVTANDWVYSACFSHDDRVLAAGSFDGHVLVFDAMTMEKRFDVKRHDQQIFGVTFSQTGEWLASCAAVWRWDGTEREETSGFVSLVNMANNQRDYYVEGLTAGVRGIDFSPKENSLAIGDEIGSMRIWDVDQRRVLARVDTSKIIRNIRYSPDGSVLAIATTTGLELRDSQSLRSIANYGDHNSRAIAFSPDGQHLAYRVVSGIVVLELPHLTQTQLLESSPASAWDIAFVPDGKTLASSGADGIVKLWNLETGHEVVNLAAHRGFVSGLAVSHDGNILASSGDDKSIRFWRANPAHGEGRREK